MPGNSLYFALFFFAMRAQDLSGDFYQEKRIISEDDVIRLDLEKFISFKSSSVNFSSNNQKIELPGIDKTQLDVPFAAGKSLQPRVFKASHNYLFFLDQDGQKVHESFVEGGTLLSHQSEVDEVIALINQTRKVQCMDMGIGGESMLFVLCSQADRKNLIEGTIEQYLIASDFFKKEVAWVAKFKSRFMENPTIKILKSPKGLEDVSNESSLFIIFDKVSSSSAPETSQKLLILHVAPFASSTIRSFRKAATTLVGLSVGEEGEVLQGAENLESRTKTLSDYLTYSKLNAYTLQNSLFGTSSQRFQLKNLYIDSLGSMYFLLGIWGESGPQIFVHTCEFTQDFDDGSFFLNECRPFIEAPITNFFLKKSYYLYIDNNNNMLFSKIGKESRPKAGQIQKGWKIEHILLEDDIAVVIMTIKNTIITFIRDFSKDTLVWYYSSPENAKRIFLMSVFDRQARSEEEAMQRKLVSFFDWGFRISSVSLNKVLEIKSASIEKLQRIELRLENELIMDLDIRQFKPDVVYDDFEGRKLVVTKTEDKLFKLRLGFSGSRLVFEPGLNQQIYYYNLFSSDIQLPKGGPKRIFAQGDSLYVFGRSWVEIQRCSYRLVTLEASCEAEDRIEGLSVPISSITSLEQYAEFLFGVTEKAEEIFLFNTVTRKQEKISNAKLLVGGDLCKLSKNKIFCRFTDETRGVQFIRAFDFKFDQEKGTSLAEHVSFAEVLRGQDTLMPRVINDLEFSRLLVQDFGIDSVHVNHVTIFYRFVHGGTSTSRFLSLKLRFHGNDPSKTEVSIERDIHRLNENSDIKKDAQMVVLDTQLVFVSFDPSFKMICFESDGYFKFDFINADLLLQRLSLPSNNLLGFVYKSRSNEKVFFALFKVTHDASKQFIHQSEVQGYSASSRWLLYEIDPYTVGVLQFDEEGERTILAVHFENGPILTGSSTKDLVTINENKFYLDTIEDKTFNLFATNFVLSPHLSPKDLPADGIIDLEKYVSITGHLSHIAADPESAKRVEVINPIVPGAFTEAGTIRAGQGVAFRRTGEVVIFRNSDGKFQFFNPAPLEQLGPERFKPFVFEGVPGNKCDELEVTSNSLLCFFAQGPLERLAILSFASFTKPEIYTLSRGGSKVKVLLDGAKLIFGRLHSDHKYLTIYKIDRAEKTVEAQLFSKKNLRSNTIKITDFHLAMDSSMKFLTVIAFDKVSNLLHLFHSDLKMTRRPVLRQSFRLDKVGTFFRQMTCVDFDSNSSNLQFECNLYGDSQISTVKIVKENQAKTSSYSWRLELLRSYKNLLYASSFQENFSFLEAISVDFTVLVGDIPSSRPSENKGEKFLIVYKLSKATDYAYSTMRIPIPYEPIDVSIDGDTIKLYMKERVESNLFKISEQTFTIGGYKMKLNKPSDLPKDGITLRAIFSNENMQKIKFTFGKDEGVVTIESESAHLSLIILIVAVCLVGLLILLSVTAIIVLHLKNKKLSEEL